MSLKGCKENWDKKKFKQIPFSNKMKSSLKIRESFLHKYSISKLIISERSARP
jgi:hypothetical protein